MMHQIVIPIINSDLYSVSSRRSFVSFQAYTSFFEYASIIFLSFYVSKRQFPTIYNIFPLSLSMNDD